MKFILVNHRSPLQISACTECARPLGTGYLREVSSQRQYCDHDCYLRYQTSCLFMPWLATGRGERAPAAGWPATTWPATTWPTTTWPTTTWPATPYVASYELMTSFAAASCWYSISLARAALRVGELMATESFGPFSGGD